MFTPTALGAMRATVAVAALAAATLAQTPSPLTIGNLFVVRIGDGVTALSGAACPVFIDEYTTTGTLVQSIAMPTAVSGTNQPLTNSGTATSEGFLNVSANGIYLTLTGYTAIPGTAAIAATQVPATPRVIGRIDLFGTVDTSTTITDAFNAGNPRSVVSTDGVQFWVAGSNSGVRYSVFGGSTTSALNAGAPTNLRVLGIYDNRLFTTSNSGLYTGLCQVGSLPTVPTTPGQIVTMLPGMVNPGPTPYDFYFASPNLVYIADDRAVASNGGLQRWDLVAGSWVNTYTFPIASVRCVTGYTQNGVTTLWATANGNSLVSLVDTGATSTPTTLVTSPSNKALRGIRYFGKPSTLSRLTAGCGSADISMSGNGETGTDMVTTLWNPTGFPFLIYGASLVGVPLFPCGCTLVPSLDVLVQTSQNTLSIPNNPGLIGVSILTQGMDFLAAQDCLGVPTALTDGYSFTIQ